MTDQLHLTLSVDAADFAERLAAAVDALLPAKTSPPRLMIALEGESLPPARVAALVAALRRLREQGGAIAVEPRSAALRDALALHGLDRVFALPLTPDEPTRRPRAPWLPRVAAAAVAALVSSFGPAPAKAAPGEPAATLGPAAVIAHVLERNPNLSSFQGRLHVDVRLETFPWIRQHLEASTYYTRPANYEVVFDHVPSYARGFQKLFTDVGDPSNWEKRFVITADGEETFDHHADIRLRMVQRVRGMIDHETVLINPATWTIDRIRYDYYNGGAITMSQEFRNVGGYSLLAAQRADINIPHVHAVAYASYSDYQTNVAVDTTVFGGGAQ